ncbi:MAG: AAA family ATPase, partial [Agathobacter rectalis]
MMNTMKLPVGIDDFRKLRESDFYYVDKTRLI